MILTFLSDYVKIDQILSMFIFNNPYLILVIFIKYCRILLTKAGCPNKLAVITDNLATGLAFPTC